jgi:hypothetical protein
MQTMNNDVTKTPIAMQIIDHLEAQLNHIANPTVVCHSDPLQTANGIVKKNMMIAHNLLVSIAQLREELKDEIQNLS